MYGQVRDLIKDLNTERMILWEESEICGYWSFSSTTSNGLENEIYMIPTHQDLSINIIKLDV